MSSLCNISKLHRNLYHPFFVLFLLYIIREDCQSLRTLSVIPKRLLLGTKVEDEWTLALDFGFATPHQRAKLAFEKKKIEHLTPQSHKQSHQSPTVGRQTGRVVKVGQQVLRGFRGWSAGSRNEGLHQSQLTEEMP